MVVGIVAGMPHAGFEMAAIVVLVAAICLALGINLGKLLLRSLIVLPFAGVMAAMMPLRYLGEWSGPGLAAAYAQGWLQMLDLIATSWLCVLVMLLLVSITPQNQMLTALARLHVPQILVLLLSFLYRYLSVMRHQITAAHRSLVARAPGMSHRRQVLLYGNLAGSMVIRAYSRGERIYSAMLSRGFTGTLPTTQPQKMAAPDALIIALSLLLAFATVLI
jgi:cobalt/nickel transport system permease protein